MKKKFLSLLLVTTLVLSGFGGVAQASSTSQQAEKKKDEAKKALDELNSQMDDILKQQETMRGQMDSYEAELVELMVSVDVIKGEIREKEAELKAVRKELKVAKQNEKKQYEDMKLRIKYMYEQGDSAFIEAILGAQSMAELLNQAEYYEKVYSYDRNLLVTYQETKLETQRLAKTVKKELTELEGMEESLKAEEKSLKAVMAKLKDELSDYDAKLASAKEKADSYKATIVAQNKIIKEEKKRQEELDRRREEEGNNPGDGSGGSGGGGSEDPGYQTGVTSSELIAYAEQFVGKPYVWGGTDPHTGADCSGYIQYVYAHFGISIPRTSYLQRFAGREVSFENAKPGDIICYEGHVALYYGNNRILHAKGRDYGIVITDNAKYHPIITIRRVL